MRPLAVALLLMPATLPVFSQEEDGVEISEDGPPPRRIEFVIKARLRDLRPFSGGREVDSWRRLPRLQALALYARAVHMDLEPADRKGLSALWVFRKRGNIEERRGDALDVATIILALSAANPTPDARPQTTGKKTSKGPPKNSRCDKDQWALMGRCVAYLTETAQFRQNADGGWGAASSDLATTHFVLLGLREAARAGQPVEADAFNRALAYLRSVGEGGVYRDDPKLTPDLADQARGMICAWICREQLALLGQPLPDWSRDLAERTSLLDPVFQNPAESPSIECLWVVEQIGSLTGRKEFGGHDWYKEGSDYLLAAAWPRPDADETERLFSLCYGLLFLKRPTLPLAAGK